MTEAAPLRPSAVAAPGRFIAVVGPSGAGKDTVMRAMTARRAGLKLVRRVVTRADDAGGEDHEAVDRATFEARRAAGDFVLAWSAHGHLYGIPAAVRDDLGRGHDVLANVSRGVLAEAARALPRLAVLSLTARPDVLSARLARRGRETPEEIARRLARRVPLPPGLDAVMVSNDGPVETTANAALEALYPASGRRSIR